MLQLLVMNLPGKLGYTEDVLNDPRMKRAGTLYNSNWLECHLYTGMQWERSYWNSDLNQRHDPAYINESVNYFHKPLVNLNWYSQFSDVFSLYSTVYYSGGQGGGQEHLEVCNMITVCYKE